MSSSNQPPKSADQDDPWEQLADLVGLQGGKEYTASPPPAADRVGPRSVARPVETPITEREPEREVAPEITFSPEPEAEPGAESAAESAVGETAEEPRDFAADFPAPAPASSSSPQDSYWDALANWNWDESEGGAGRAAADSARSSGNGPSGRSGGSRGRDDRRERRGGDRPERGSSHGSSRPPSGSAAPGRAQRPAPPPPSDDFGLGVTAEEAQFSSPVEDSPHESSSAAADEPKPAPPAGREETRSESTGSRGGERPRRGDRGGEDRGEGDGSRKRRRRRRRRGRGGDREPAGAAPAPEAAVPGADWDDSAGPESDFTEESDSATSSSPAEAVDEGSGDRPARPPRGRGRDRRREGSSRRGPRERSDDRFDEESGEPHEISQGGGASGPELDDGDDSGEPVVSYENVPTWEEAISYLLHPSQVQVEAGSTDASNPPRGAAPTDQPRQTRHLGYRKHRR